jgi:uncharacterized protein involved in tolerance to divalent cations
MKIRDFVLAVVLLFITWDFVFADRQLDRAEVLQIFQTLTDQPRKTWIPAGTIKAKHLEYEALEGYIAESTVLVRYDGDRFYWAIDIDSLSRQIQPNPSPHGKSSQDDFDLNWNKKRVFAWDGQRYTMYFRPGNHAIVNENPSGMPVNVNGPLTAGIVPWGYGVYTLENLLAAQSSAKVDDRGQVHLTLNKIDMPEMVFVLDSTKDYAVLFYSINNVGRSSIVKTYGDYELVSGKWTPTTIVIERYDDSKQPYELLSYDEWDLTSISVSIPQPESFGLSYETNAFVEYYLPNADRPLSYHHCSKVDTDSLLQDKRAMVLAGNMQTQKCATVAMKYVAEQLGQKITTQQLASLVNEPNQVTSLYQLQQFAQELGFHCLAVKTDLQTLKNLKHCQAILHLPRAQHYVVLEHIDDEYVWLIDLASNKFYYHIKLDMFDLNWSEGTALLVSSEPLHLEETLTGIDEEELHKIIGSLLIPYYSCTKRIQRNDDVFCPQPIGGLCGGRYRIYYERYACEPNVMGGYCIGTGMIGSLSSPCEEDGGNPGACVCKYEWISQCIRACK